MKGFKSRVSRDVKSAGRSASSDFSASMKGAGKAAGEKVGRDLKSAVDASAGSLGTGALKGMNREVATASASLSKARLKQQDEAGKVRVAEARLQEAIAKSGADSSRAVSAEERLAAARRSHKAATDSVTAATSRLKGAQEALKQASSVEASTSWWKRLGTSASTGLGSFLSSVRDLGARAGQALGAAFKGAATAGITVAAAAMGIALTSGFKRLTTIDEARAKLVGLGHDGSTVATIMKGATAAVSGTAFGLGEAATVAAGAVAAGIKPGTQLEKTLKGVANVAAATNRTMEDTGSIFNNVRANQAAYTEDIKQLANAGLPIWDELQKKLGKTQAEVRKMATKGEIDFDTFADAAGKAAGTVADEMGNTVPASIKNMFASLGRTGANIFGGINTETGEMYGLYAKLAPLIQSITSAMAPLEEKAKAWGKTLESTVGPAMDWLTGLFERLGSGSDDLKSKFSGLAPLLAPVGAAFVALGAGGLAGAIKGSRLLGPLLGGLAGPLAALGGPLGIVAAGFAGFALSGGDAGALVKSVTGVIDQVVAALPGLVLQFVRFVPQLVDSLLGQMPVLMNAAFSLINALAAGIVEAVPLLVSGAVVLIDGLAAALLDNLPVLISGAINIVNALLAGIVAAAPVLIAGAVQLLSSLLGAIVSALPLIIEGGVRLLLALVDGIVNALPMLLEAAFSLVQGLLVAIVENLPLLIESGIQLLLSLATGLLSALPMLIEATITLVLQLVAGLLTMLPELIAAGIELVVALIVGLVEAIPQIIEMLPQIISAIWDGLANVDWLDLGAQIIKGIIDGFFSMVGAVGDAVGSIVKTITDFFPHSPAKRGPLSGAGWYRLKDSGGAMISQFNDGALAGASEFEETMAAMARSATQKAQAVMGRASATMSVSSTSAAQGGAGRPIEQNNYFAHEDPQVGIELGLQKLASLLGGS